MILRWGCKRSLTFPPFTCSESYEFSFLRTVCRLIKKIQKFSVIIDFPEAKKMKHELIDVKKSGTMPIRCVLPIAILELKFVAPYIRAPDKIKSYARCARLQKRSYCFVHCPLLILMLPQE